MTKEEAVEKIRKLLARNGRTHAEIDTAQLLAAALADKHGIDIAAMDAADDQRKAAITHRTMGKWAVEPPEATYASLICQKFFEVDAITRSGWMEELVLVGTEWHLTLAEYVFRFLMHEFRWQWNKRRGRCRKRKEFIYGCYIALFSKLSARFEKPANGMALEISFKAKRDAYIKDNFSTLSSASAAPKAKRSSAREHGYRAGQEIDIRPGVEAGESRSRPSLPGFDGRLLTNGKEAA